MISTTWLVRDQNAAQLLGYIPAFIDADDDRPVAEQINERYAHGGGWRPLSGFHLDGHVLVYPGTEETEDEPAWPDERYLPIAYMVHPLTDEMVVVYERALVVIVKPDGVTPEGEAGWQVARLD